MTNDFTIGWSDFAKERHVRGTGFSFSSLTNEEVLDLVRVNWVWATPGTGETDLTRKILVPVPAENFHSSTILINDPIPVSAKVTRRSSDEDPFVQNYITPQQADDLNLEPEFAIYVSVVCYSAAALEENDERSTNCDWEIIAIVASPVENEPMTPLAMARNMLDKEGGTKSEYTAEEFAEAIYYWSQRVRIKKMED